ncbi:MAG: Ig-like domain repeat protein, partial [Opitutaceae bacterium]|nr:Ig-like domain repeat protein [Opitutaceae bacterium]
MNPISAVLGFIGLSLGASAFGGTLLRQSFESADWPARTVATTGGATAAVAYGAYGTIDTQTDVANNGVDAPSKGLLLTVNSSAAVGAWKAGLGSGVLALTTNNTTITNLGLVTLSFSLRASRANPVVVRLESYDDAGTLRTGGLSRLIYPAAPNYYQRFALDLSTFAPDGAGTFVPTAKKILVTFELDSAAGGDGWPAASGLTLKIDNLNYATPAWYVATNGTDNTSGGRGTAATLPFLTANYAMSLAQPGDIIVLRGGTYNNSITFRKYVVATNSFVMVIGAPDAWVVLRSYPGETPVIRSKLYGTISFGMNNYTGPACAYLEIRGMTTRGYSTVDANGDRDLDPAVGSLQALLGKGGEVNCSGISADGRSMTNLMHDIRIADNVSEYETGGGIGVARVDKILIENNVSRYNSWWTGYGSSGFSSLVPVDFENNADYRAVFQNNQSYGNETMAPAVGNDVRFTDGNGIIIDINRNDDVAAGTGLAYRGRTLVQNNLVYNNGGSGIHAFNAQNVDIVHNTAYLNSASPRLEYAQIYAGYSKNVNIRDNILVAPGNPSGDATRNEPFISNGSQNVSGTIFYQNNLFYGLGNNITAPSGNVLTPAGNFAPNTTGADPLFIAPSRNPSAANFRLRSTSPALNIAAALSYRSGVDITGRPRLLSSSTTDLGAYQTQPSTAFSPVLTPAPANYLAAQSVVLSSPTSGATLVYTTNGTTPAVNASGVPTNGTVYTAAIPVSVATTVQAIAWKSGLATSDVSGDDYTFVNSTAVPIPNLLFYPDAGTYAATTLTGIICRTPGALVRYTIDGSTPTSTYGTLATNAMVSIKNYTTLKAIAYIPGRPNSAVKTGVFTITGSAGNTSPGTVLESIGANQIRFVKLTTTSANTLANVYARVSGAGTYRVALYSDSSGQPSTRLATSNAVVNPAAGWATFTFSTPYAAAAATSYWLAIWTDTATAQIYADTSGGTVRELASTLGGNGTWPNPVGATAVAVNSAYSYALYASPQNIAPAVSVANTSLAVALPASASVGATVTDDGLPKLPGATSVVWTRTSGPGTVTFANSTALSTTAGFSVAGDYVLRVTATDGSLSTYAEVTVSVSAASGALDPSPPSGIVRARFTDGAGTTYPQQFAGVVGDGWTGPWAASASAGATVINTAPLQTGSGNYLKLTRSSGTSTAEGIYRQWSGTTRPYNQFSRLKFDVRIDSDTSVFNSYGDSLHITDRPGGSVGTGGDSRFYIRVIGGSIGTLQTREWGVYNGNGINFTFSDSNFVPSGMICVPGVTYTFTIDVFAADAAGTTSGKTNGTYDVTITDGTNTVTVPGARFRDYTAFNSGGYLSFSTQQSVATDNLGFSVDNIEITSVAPTATTLATSVASADFGQGVTFTATVTGGAGTPSGTVVFRVGATALGTATLNGSGVATFTTNTLAAGTHAITATYLAGPGYLTSTSASLSQSVLAATATTLVSNANPATLGSFVTFTATVTGEAGTPTGTVSFISDSVLLGTSTLDGFATATLTTSTLSVGLHTVTANYNGSASFSAGTPGGLTQTIQRTDGTTRALAINCAGSDIAGSGFEADFGVPGGSVVTRTNPIDRTGVTYPAPEAVYQTERYGSSITYT